MAQTIVHETHLCRDCGMPLDCQSQDNGKGGFITLMTCWNPACLLRTVTRTPATYYKLTETELEAYREMNRVREATV